MGTIYERTTDRGLPNETGKKCINNRSEGCTEHFWMNFWTLPLQLSLVVWDQEFFWQPEPSSECIFSDMSMLSLSTLALNLASGYSQQPTVLSFSFSFKIHAYFKAWLTITHKETNHFLLLNFRIVRVNSQSFTALKGKAVQ